MYRVQHVQEVQTMMGRQHALTGVLAAGSAAYVLRADVPTFVLLCTTLPGTAILNDIDHPDSTVSSTYGPITGLLSQVLSHRKQTHSVPGILAFSTLVYVATVHPSNLIARAFLAIVLVLIWSATIRLFKIKGWVDDVIPIPFALAVTFGEPLLIESGISPFPFKYLPYMIALGMLTHVVGDLMTKQKIPLWWPFSDKGTALGLFKAGGKFEMWIMLPLIVIGSGTFIVRWVMDIT
jgi:membrane-bound metal-dependent hydrolase YbcI (DUF457 family)